MEQTFCAEDITVGFHPEGYRIDKTVAPTNWYTKWEIRPGNRWCRPIPVAFDSLPKRGWIGKDKFDWDRSVCHSVELLG